MDLRKVKKLIELAEEAGLAELEVTSGDESVRIALARPSAVLSGAAPIPQTPAPAASAPRPSAKATWIPAPMAGTFYRAPNPDAEPFVQVGDTVQAGEVLCIIESMKMMNEVTSTTSGTVREICVANAEAVATGAALFVIS